MLKALTRRPARKIADCELTHIERERIDADGCRREHSAYEDVLRSIGVQVIRLPDAETCADGVFVEDTALVLSEGAVLCRPGADSRLPELADVELALRDFRSVHKIAGEGRLDGGDILVAQKSLFVGVGGRSNTAAVNQLRTFVEPWGYSVTAVPLSKCLHLKTAVSWLGGKILLVNTDWVEVDVFKGYDLIPISKREPFAGNVLVVGDVVLCAAAHVETAEILRRRGMNVRLVEMRELAKAEAGLTCCSIVFADPAS